jgi:hypothetical protein
MSEPRLSAQLKPWISLPTIAAFVLISVLVFFMLTASRSEGQTQDTTSSSTKELRVEDAGSNPASPSSSTDEEATSEHERVVDVLAPDEATYKKAKAEANAEANAKKGKKGKKRANQPSGGENTSSLAPQATQNVLSSLSGFEGVSGSAPHSDSNGAIGPSQYIELTNAGFLIYDRSKNAIISQGTLNTLTGQAGHVNDPMTIWDPDTNRFYYTTGDMESSTDYRIDFGFSKTSTPSSDADFCKYTIPLGSIQGDFPRLGDTKDFLLIGTNNFKNKYIGSYLYSVTKPPTGDYSSCPDKSTFTVDQTTQPLNDTSSKQVFDPVPANQVDTSGTGWVIARAGTLPASNLLIYQVTKNSSGHLTVNTAKNLSVASYKLPADAPQLGTATLLDTLDAGPTQAVSAIDPSRNGAVALWAQHTVFGGSGAEVRWYEIDPSTTSVFQKGTISDPLVSDGSGRYIFNAAISPDRMNSGQTQQYGDSMVVTYNSSSTIQFPDIRMVSKEADPAPRSSETLIEASLTAFTSGNGCKVTNLCHWGDYPGASPDPGAPGTGAHGQVWLTNMWAKSSGVWGTWNWAATP